MTNSQRIDIARNTVTNLLPMANRIELVGSTYISDCKDSDVDILVWVNDFPHELPEEWVEGGSGGSENGFFKSYKTEIDSVEINLLMVEDKNYFDKWVLASKVCRFLHNLNAPNLTKGAVHGVHAVIMDDADPEDEHWFRGY